MKIYIVESKNNPWRRWRSKEAYLDLQDALSVAEEEGNDEALEPLGFVSIVDFNPTKLQLYDLIALIQGAMDDKLIRHPDDKE